VCPKRRLDVNHVEEDERENPQINDSDEYSSVSSKKPQKVSVKTMPTIKNTDHGYEMPKIKRSLITNVLITGLTPMH
jgi:hypothetical protein